MVYILLLYLYYVPKREHRDDNITYTLVTTNRVTDVWKQKISSKTIHPSRLLGRYQVFKIPVSPFRENLPAASEIFSVCVCVCVYVCVCVCESACAYEMSSCSSQRAKKRVRNIDAKRARHARRKNLRRVSLCILLLVCIQYNIIIIINVLAERWHDRVDHAGWLTAVIFRLRFIAQCIYCIIICV